MFCTVGIAARVNTHKIYKDPPAENHKAAGLKLILPKLELHNRSQPVYKVLLPGPFYDAEIYPAKKKKKKYKIAVHM